MYQESLIWFDWLSIGVLFTFVISFVSSNTSYRSNIIIITILASLMTCYAGIPLAYMIFKYYSINAIISILLADITIIFLVSFMLYTAKILPQYNGDYVLKMHVLLQIFIALILAFFILFTFSFTFVISGQDKKIRTHYIGSRIFTLSQCVSKMIFNSHDINKMMNLFHTIDNVEDKNSITNLLEGIDSLQNEELYLDNSITNMLEVIEKDFDKQQDDEVITDILSNIDDNNRINSDNNIKSIG